MWSEALALLAQAESLGRQAFRPSSPQALRPSWEPPVDLLETTETVLIIAALPGVDADQAEVYIQDGVLVLSGQRVLPSELRTAVIHRLELPQGRFERRVPLPPGRYGAIGRFNANGCLVVTLQKAQP
jgi:HSP20 family molecular chaperone IbpA